MTLMETKSHLGPKKRVILKATFLRTVLDPVTMKKRRVFVGQQISSSELAFDVYVKKPKSISLRFAVNCVYK